MRNALIVHDDSTLSRVAYIIEQRKKDIRFFESVLRGDPGIPEEYYHVNKDQVKQELESERWALGDLIEDIEDGLLMRELKEVFRQYVSQEEVMDDER